MSLERKKCSKCPIPIVWVPSEKTGRPMPVDAEPVANGNVLLKRRGDGWVAVVLGHSAAEDARALGQALFINHFATCAFSKDFRKHG